MKNMLTSGAQADERLRNSSIGHPPSAIAVNSVGITFCFGHQLHKRAIKGFTATQQVCSILLVPSCIVPTACGHPLIQGLKPSTPDLHRPRANYQRWPGLGPAEEPNKGAAAEDMQYRSGWMLCSCWLRVREHRGSPGDPQAKKIATHTGHAAKLHGNVVSRRRKAK